MSHTFQICQVHAIAVTTFRKVMRMEWHASCSAQSSGVVCIVGCMCEAPQITEKHLYFMFP